MIRQNDPNTFDQPGLIVTARAGEGRRLSISLALLILLVTLPNAVKPMHIDDAVFYYHAVQVAHHPLDPYGFTALWTQWPERGVEILCPPVLPYWWAIAIRLFGNSPLMWKLWLWPFVAMFVVSLHGLFRRFARGMEMPLVFLTVLSPTFLPAMNLMMDIPAMALGLTAVCIALLAIDGRSYGLSLLAGVVAGLAMETKYSAALFPVAIFLYGILNRRTMLAIIPGVVAAALFGLWELLVYRHYGTSQFVFHLRLTDEMKGFVSKSMLWTAVPLLIGGLIPMLGVLGLAALGLPSVVLAIAFGGIVVLYAAIAYSPVAVSSFLLLGLGTSVVIALVAYAVAKHGDRNDAFVLLWSALELVGFMAVSPFAASRRAMGLVIVLTLLIGRFASRVRLPQRRRAAVNWIVGAGIAFGFGFYGLDLTEAFAQKHALENAEHVVDSRRRAGQTVWFTGHWGFQFYAEQAGYVPVIPDHSNLKRGDFVLFPHPLINSQKTTFPKANVNELQRIQITDHCPLSMVPFYYGDGIALQNRSWPRVTVSVYQVTSDFVPVTSYSPEYLADWAINRHCQLPTASFCALLRTMGVVDSKTAQKLAHAINISNPNALKEGLLNSDPKIQETVRKFLQSNSVADIR